MLGQSEQTKVKVVTRFRPFNERETGLGLAGASDAFKLVENTIQANNITFTFTKCFPMETRQQEVFEHVAQQPMKDLFNGFNATIFAYGQTGSGKSFSMFGKRHDVELKGIVPRCTDLLFNSIRTCPNKLEFTISCSYLEIYQEKITDLLNIAKRDLPVREHKGKGVFVEGLTKEYVRSEQDIYKLLDLGDTHKKKCATKMNPDSSRSHCCFTINLEVRDESDNVTEACLNLVDLAGSERVGKTGATGQALEEAKKINTSLTCLSACISALSEGTPHVPFRDSKLTRLLQDSLGGNSKTSVLVALSPHPNNMDETLSSLRFAQRCSSLTTTATKNLKLTADDLQAMVDAVKAELSRVQATSGVAVETTDNETQTNEGDFVSPTAEMEQELQKKNEDLQELEKTLAVQLEEHNTLLSRLDDMQREIEALRQQTQSLPSNSSTSLTRNRPSTSGHRRLTHSRISFMNIMGGKRHSELVTTTHASNSRQNSMGSGSGSTPPPLYAAVRGAASLASLPEEDAQPVLTHVLTPPQSPSRPSAVDTSAENLTRTDSLVQKVSAVEQMTTNLVESPQSLPAQPRVPPPAASVAAPATTPAAQPVIPASPKSKAAPPPFHATSSTATRASSKSVKNLRKEMKKALKSRKKEAKDRLKSLSKELDQIQDENAELELRCDDQNDIIARQQEVVAKLEERIVTMEEEVNELQDERQEQQRQLAELEAQYATMLKEGSAETQQAKVKFVVQKESVLQQAHAEEDSGVLSNIFNVFSFGVFGSDEPPAQPAKRKPSAAGGGLLGIFK